MDNHPIPQDVTNFQFHLIGDMTIKQFGFIIAGVVLAWVMLAAPLFPLLRLLFAGSFVLGAVFLAFVPVEGRPSDIMVMHFLRALFSPTQFTYQKSAQPIQTSTVTTTTPPAPLPQQQKKEEKEEKVQVESFTPIATAAVQQHVEETKVEEATIKQSAPMQPTQTPTSAQDALLQQEVSTLSQELAKAKAQENQQQDAASGAIAHEKVTTLEGELQEIMKQKEVLEKQLVALQKSLNQKKEQVFTPSAATEKQETAHVKKLSKSSGIHEGAPLVPDVPNLIAGVIKDPRGNVLSNILIEVKDKDGNPVRAFKSNQLGQFAAATPLVNGIYTISFEDPAAKQSFDSVEIQAVGEILLPLEIISVDAREKLRQELFGAQGAPTT